MKNTCRGEREREGVRERERDASKQEEGRKRVTNLEFAHSSIDSCIQCAVELHGERVSALRAVATDTMDHSTQLFHIVHHQLNAILNWIQRGLGEKGRGRREERGDKVFQWCVGNTLTTSVCTTSNHRRMLGNL